MYIQVPRWTMSSLISLFCLYDSLCPSRFPFLFRRHISLVLPTTHSNIVLPLPPFPIATPLLRSPPVTDSIRTNHS
ncbi:hypothetical protein M407DRAFT_132310 [Tulasnella calospora MUT 4182]|uniref:Uncharacterized protein n=1 Tax=Tulasnella calospora MUT 4182 TaxID=1051891 RepID=A0A0C3LHQ8_9AGAM|nr:hypothetical protein M407DRAFT_132310 [Tulasnella calospora MUT 4182]